MHRTHISGKYKCANLATGVGEIISVLTGVLSTVCTQELWVMRQVYQDFFYSAPVLSSQMCFEAKKL